ncbi:hypothetical protein ASD47_25080 [Caulobacter sp. Root1472]|nr:hypothetical protein ASD47_25080 [Caulobacter sp. Root1472]
MRLIMAAAAAVVAAVGEPSQTWAQASTTYTYDPQGQLKTVARASGTLTYSYDAAGNRTQLAVSAGGSMARASAPLAAVQSSETTDEAVKPGDGLTSAPNDDARLAALKARALVDMAGKPVPSLGAVQGQ